ncbi:MAG TPA: type II toxin-antitoxin system death-on-curing family toxin [Jatrophihabitans sp.]|jgi:death-on-curing protein|nr:type II toxin-antitoxin system death-on-curing family toxin [Jatrophihabitans sp.]
MTDLLTLEDALAVLDELGLVVADPGLLASAIARPAATVFGADAYPDLTGKVAALLESVVRNHALVDGNKRAGWALAVVTIWLNDRELSYDEDEAFATVMRVAEGNSTLTEITEWFADRLRARV